MAGVELPIMVAMGGMVLVHLAGRMTTGVLSDDAVHAVVLTITLALLAGMGLMGRNDLGLRIPSALEALLVLLVLDKVLSILLGGSPYFATDPFAVLHNLGAASVCDGTGPGGHGPAG